MPAPVPHPAPSPSSGGILRAVLAGVFFGATVPLSKSAFAGIDPWFASAWIYGTAGLLFVPALLVRAPRPERRLRAGDARWLVAGTVVGCVLAPYAYLRGLAANPPHVTSLLVHLEAVFGPLLALLVFGERLTRRRLAGLGVLLASAAATAILSVRDAGRGAGSSATPLGAAFVAAACLGWALDTNLTRRVAARDARLVVVVHNLGGALVSLALAFAVGDGLAGVDGRVLRDGAIAGTVGYGLAFLCLVEALDRLGAARASVVFLIVGGAAGVVASAIASGEPPPLWIYGVFAAIAVGLVLSAGGDDAPAPGASPSPVA